MSTQDKSFTPEKKKMGNVKGKTPSKQRKEEDVATSSAPTKQVEGEKTTKVDSVFI